MSYIQKHNKTVIPKMKTKWKEKEKKEEKKRSEEKKVLPRFELGPFGAPGESFTTRPCLRADVSYFLCCTRKRDVCVTPSLIVFQRPAGFPRSWEHAVIGWHTVRIVWLNADGLLLNWSDNVCSDVCNRGFPVKTNQNMCHCVHTVRNLVRGRGKFNVCEEIIS